MKHGDSEAFFNGEQRLDALDCLEACSARRAGQLLRCRSIDADMNLLETASTKKPACQCQADSAILVDSGESLGVSGHLSPEVRMCRANINAYLDAYLVGTGALVE